MSEIAISVLTPTYNRAHVLHRAYESLQRQTTRNFEWIVVDDGSTDETPTLLAHWQAEADFPVTVYRYSNNRGVHAAVNSGRNLISGDYMVVLDSDDAFLDDAMATIEYWRTKSGIDDMPSVYAMTFRCTKNYDDLVDGEFCFGESEINIMSRLEAIYRFKMTSETCIVVKAAIARMRHFVELTQSECCPESITHNRMSKCYNSMYIDHPVLRYYRNDGVERLTDGLASTVRWPRGNYLKALAVLNDEIGYFEDSPGVFLRAGRMIAVLGLHIGRSPWRQFHDLAHGRARLFWIVGLPRSLVRYMRDRLRGRKAPKAHRDIAAWGPAMPPENPILRVPPGRGRPSDGLSP